jgi:1-acyl-sn-glycerol-3-phosphate acyltransferase
MIFLRSLLFNIVFYLNMLAHMLAGLRYLWRPRIDAIQALQRWATSSLWWLKVICGTKMEVRGREFIPHGPAIIAGKHQSFWETFAVLPHLDDPCMVMKEQLFSIPLFGRFAKKFDMIAVDRGAGSTALRNLVTRSKQAIADNRQLVIMPEGTRRAPDDPPDYKPGVSALYGQLNVPCVPFGLNSGLFWPRRKFLRYPGTITIEFCAAIPPGLPRKQFEEKMQNAIESTSNRLIAEARQAQVRK